MSLNETGSIITSVSPEVTTSQAGQADEIRLLHTFDDAGAVLDLSGRTVRRLVEAGELEAVKIGRSSRIPHESLVEFVERLRARP